MTMEEANARLIRENVALEATITELREERQKDALDGQASLDEANNMITKLREENARLKAPMKPVAWLAQFKYDKIHNQTFFTNDQKVRMPAEYASGYDWLPLYYPAPPAFLIAEAEARGRKEALLEAADVFDKQSNRELFCGTVADELRNMANKEE